MNTFGRIFRLTTFGESHGAAIGGVIDGFPAGIDIDMDFIQQELNRRRPGQSHITTDRHEAAARAKRTLNRFTQFREVHLQRPQNTY